MEWLEMSKAYVELGILGLCGVLIAAIAWISFKKANSGSDKKDARLEKYEDSMEARFDKMMLNMQEQNQTFLSQQIKSLETMMNAFVNQVTTHVPSSQENNELTKIAEELDVTLQQILIATNASRVNIVQYHNGGRGINRQSFLKMSMTNEQVQLGVKPFISEFREQFRSVIAYIIKELNDKGYCYIEDINDVKELDSGTYEFLIQRGIEAKYCMAIHNKSGAVIGFLGVEFIHKANANTQLIDKIMKEKQSLLEFLLSKEV